MQSLQAEFTNLFFYSPHATWLYAPSDLRILEANAAALDLYGYSREEFLRLSALDLRPQEDIPDFLSMLHAAGEKGVLKQTFRYLTKQGEIIVAEAFSYPVPFEDGVARLVWVNDMTELLKKEEQAREMSKKLADTLEMIPAAFFTVDKSWNVIYWNREAERLLGIKRTRVLNTCLWDLYPGSVMTKLYKNYLRVMEERKPIKFRLLFKPINKFLFVSAYPVSEGISVYFYDITAEKEKGEALQKALERFELVNAATSDLIIDWEVIDNRVSTNNSLSSIFGYPHTGIASSVRWWVTILHPDERLRVIHTLSNSIARKSKSLELEFMFKCFDGSFKPVFAQVSLIYSKNQLVRVIGALKDLKPIREMETQLRNEQRKISSIAYINSHEIRRPLANIIGLTSILEDDHLNDQREVLSMLKTSAEELDLSIRKIAKHSK